MKAGMRQRGFTSRDRVAGLAVLAILAVLVVPAWRDSVTRRRIRAAQSDLQALSAHVESERRRTLLYPSTTLHGTTALTGRFPDWNPRSRPADFSFTYATDASGYRLTAAGVSGRMVGCSLSLTAANARTVAGCPDVGDLRW